MAGKVFFYVQHLLGIGHLYRASRIATALQDAGFAVDLVMGGVPIPGFEVAGAKVIQLPAIAAGPSGFADLVDERGEPVDAEFKTQRSAQLLAAFANSAPDIVLIEAFPFGRRQMRFELVPLLERIAAQGVARPVVACSVRDILQENRKPGRNEETVEMLNKYFDLVLVHGDPAMVTLADTFPPAAEIATQIVYTGLVAPAAPAAASLERFDIVVSAGGGVVGKGIMQAALAMARDLPRDSSMLVLTGPNLPADDAASLRRLVPEHVTLRRFVPDLPAILSNCRLSISQAGYNTVADILVAGCPSVLIPFAAGGETEQGHRARILEGAGRAVVLAERDLSAQSLAKAARQAADLPVGQMNFNLKGARNTAIELQKRLSR